MFTLIPILLASAALIEPSTCAAKMEAAQQAYGNYDVIASRRAYGEVADGRCTDEERRDASTELARITWLVDGDAAHSEARLRAIVAPVPGSCAAALLLGRVINESGRSNEVEAALTPVLPLCRSRMPAVAAEVIKARVAVISSARTIDQPAMAREAIRKLRQLPVLARLSLEASRQRLALGLVAGDSAEAEAGWHQFFAMTGLPDGKVNDGLNASTMRAGLGSGATETQRAALCDMLIRAGFTTEARRISAALGDESAPMWRSARGYFRLVDTLGGLLLEANRAYARGNRSEEDGLEAKLMSTLRAALAEAGEPVTDDPWPALRRLWNLTGTTGRSNGVEGLHLGHVSIDVEQPIQQGARRGEVRFVALDNMIANGFSGWLGDGITGPGGWAADGRIIQVRTRYVQSALDHAAISISGAAREDFLKRLSSQEALDRKNEAPRADVFLPGLSQVLSQTLACGRVRPLTL